MKKIKKILAAVMTLAMVLGMSMTTFAAPENVAGITSNITVGGLSADVDTDIDMYRFATLQYDSEKTEYSWDIATWAEPYVDLNDAGTAYEINNETALKAAVPTSTTADYSVDDVEGTSYEFKGVLIGGYIVIPNDENAEYSPLFAVNTYDRDVSPDLNGKPVAVDITVYAKSEDHTITKSQSDDFAQIGQDVNYTINATFPMSEKTDGTPLTEFIITDTPTGLSIDSSTVKVSLNGADITTQITNSVDDETGVLTVNFAGLLDDGVKYDGQAIVITYTATVTDVAYNNNAGASSSTTKYEPGNVSGDNGGIQLTKKDAEDGVTLSGAAFKVYDLKDSTDTSNLGAPMEFVKVDGSLNGYRPFILGVDEDTDKVTDVEVDGNGVLNIIGLDEGNYYFQETKAPSGYSINTELKQAVVEDGVTDFVEVEFLDTKLASLPETGGIGTTIFTIGGCIIMIAAAGLFFASRRKSSK